MVKQFLLIIILCLAAPCFPQDSEIKIWNSFKEKNDVSRTDIDSVLDIANSFKTKSPEKAFEICNWAKQKSNEISYKSGVGEGDRVIGLVKRIQGEYDSALFYFKIAEQNFRSLKEEKNIAQVYNAMAITYESKDDYKNSIYYQIKALEIFEKSGEKLGMADCYGNLGILYLNQNLYNESLLNQEKALQLFVEEKNIDGQINTNCNIGIIYANMGDLKKSLKYFLEAEKLAEHSKNVYSRASIYTNIGLIYSDLKNIKLSLEYQDRALKIFESMSDDQGVSVTLLNMAEILMKDNKVKEAIELYNRSVEICKKANIKDNLISSYHGLSACYSKLGDYKKSNEYILNYIAVKDSVLNNDNRQQIREIETKYQSTQKELEIKNLNIKKEAQATEINRQYTVLASVAVLSLLLLFLIIFISRAYVQKKKDNSIINEQKQKVELQKNEIEIQKHLIEEKQKETIDSINYALQIQKTLLANHDFVNQIIPDSFVLFKPKDIVSGDFYWATKKDEFFYLAVCDSTGHGVPGAFMSLLNISFLNEAIGEKNILEPNKVFNHVRQRLMESISQSGRQDGMDGIIICINQKNNQITYAAANNAPILISEVELKVLDADKMPVGVGQKGDSFKLYTIDYKKGDMLYLCTDGYADQFGGEKGKKFKNKQLTEKLNAIFDKPVEEQKQILQQTFENWKGNLEQVDDVTILGIKI